MEFKRFLGMLGFYRRFIKNAAEVQALLHTMTNGAKKKDKRPVKWDQRSRKSFELCKKGLAETALLAHPKEDPQLILTTDASDKAIGVSLKQEYNGQYHILGFFSRKLSKTETNYSAYDRELLAIYKAIKFFQYMVEGRQLIIRTDHKPIIFAFQEKATKSSSSRHDS